MGDKVEPPHPLNNTGKYLYFFHSESGKGNKLMPKVRSAPMVFCRTNAAAKLRKTEEKVYA